MPMHKLSEGPFEMVVESVVSVEGAFGPQYEFISADGVSVYVSELATQQQLARLDLTTDTVVGQKIHMEQVKKNGKTFTNISLVGSGGAVRPSTNATGLVPATQRAAVAPAPRMTVDEVAAVYLECVNTAFMTFGNRCEEAGVSLTADALQAATATIFIKVTR